MLENAFGIMKETLCKLHNGMTLSVKHLPDMVVWCCLLSNVLQHDDCNDMYTLNLEQFFFFTHMVQHDDGEEQNDRLRHIPLSHYLA